MDFTIQRILTKREKENTKVVSLIKPLAITEITTLTTYVWTCTHCYKAYDVVEKPTVDKVYLCTECNKSTIIVKEIYPFAIINGFEIFYNNDGTLPNEEKIHFAFCVPYYHFCLTSINTDNPYYIIRDIKNAIIAIDESYSSIIDKYKALLS